MKLIFDENKNALNVAKHGISLGDAEKIEWESLLAIEDTRHNYSEIRIIGYALIETRLYCIVFTDRNNERRIISLRKANSREVKNYVINS